MKLALSVFGAKMKRQQLWGIVVLAAFLGVPPLSGDDLSQAKAYIRSMKTMVSVEEGSDLEPAAAKLAVAHVNRWLVSQKFNPVDQAAMERIRSSQRTLWEKQVKDQVGFLQWVALQVQAGIYLELSTQVVTENTPQGSYAQVTLLIKGYDPSTGSLLASLPFRSGKAYSPVSPSDALLQAIPVAVAQAMPKAWEQVLSALESAIVDGIEYRVVIQQTRDLKAISQLRRKLETRVKSVSLVSATSEEATWDVRFIGRGDELADAVVKFAQAIPGLDQLDMVLFENRGRSITFNTNLGDVP